MRSPRRPAACDASRPPRPPWAAPSAWVFDEILRRLEPEPQAHGFVPGRSIVTNAASHTGKAVVCNLDLKDFFPSITFRRVKGLFRKLGYGEHVATLLALLCTEPPRVPVELDGKTYHVALGARVLPQGACTSPAITNALCRRLDRRLDGLARRHGFAYTRYADDLTFSGDNPLRRGPVAPQHPLDRRGRGPDRAPHEDPRDATERSAGGDGPDGQRSAFGLAQGSPHPAGDPAQRGPFGPREPESRGPARFRRPPPRPGGIRLHGGPVVRPRACAALARAMSGGPA